MNIKRRKANLNTCTNGIADLIEQWKNMDGIQEEANEYRINHAPIPKRNKLIDESRRYYLGKKYPGIYLTTQEARCMYYFMLGYTTKMTAEAMNLSDKTISFYTVNIKFKVPSHSKFHLISKIFQTDFVNYITALREMECKTAE